MDDVALPINASFADNVFVPIPPREIAKVSKFVLLTFIFVNPASEPKKLVADKVFVEVSHDKFADCEIDVAVLPINI